MDTKQELVQLIDKLDQENLQKICIEVKKLVELQESPLVECKFETDDYYDSRKHGPPYVAVVEIKDGKIERKFLNDRQVVWDSKHKYSKSRWVVRLPVGTKIEARLSDGSWKNERRCYFVVEKTGLKEVERKEVLGM